MAVTAHIYPLAMDAIGKKTIDLTKTTALTFQVGLCTGDASAFGATQEAYQFVTDVTGAYTEVSTGGYARVDISAGISWSRSGNVNTWTCSSPISFGSNITLSAHSMFIYTTQVGSADASYPVIGIVDFGQTVSSTSGAWTYTVSGSGLATWTEN